MSAEDDKKPITPVMFTELENVQNTKMLALVQKNFLQLHPEIVYPAKTDLTSMIREEKILYSNMAIQFAVQFIAAHTKSKKT